MTSTTREPSAFVERWARTGLTIGLVDALWAVVLTLAYGRSVAALWQGVAAVPFGRAMLDGGVPAALLGLGVHFCVAMFWSFVFLLAHTGSPALRRRVSTTGGMLLVAALYGPAIWCVMSLLVIPAMTGTPPVITARWAIQLCGHACFVGLPIVWTGRRTHW